MSHAKKPVSDNQRKVIEALLEHGSQTAAAEAVGLSRRTVWRYLKDPAFRSEFGRALDGVYSELAAMAAKRAGDAIECLGDVVSGTLSASLTDSDGDGLSDELEELLGTDPDDSDTDGDGLPDAWEVEHGISPLRSDGIHGAAGDFDNDGVSNLAEYQAGSDPADGIDGDDPDINLKVHRPN